MSDAPIQWSSEQRFRVREDVIVEEIDGECLLLDMREDAYYGLNPVGVIVWRALGEDASLGEVEAQVSASFEDVEAARIQQDIRAFLEALITSGLITARECTPGGVDE